MQLAFHPVHDVLNIFQDTKSQYLIRHKLSGRTYKNCYSTIEAAKRECESIQAEWQPSDLNFKFIKNAQNCRLVA
ncbi:MAG: hypothetical protein JWN07_90 [Hyphomicrobiales bacterium]|nr:hypothetical protein [Hyphomicrobiales bacterium]